MIVINVAPVRVAQVLRHMDMGGIEAIVCNYYRAINKEQVQFDFFIEVGSHAPFLGELANAGAHISELPKISRPLRYLNVLYHALRNGQYKIVHVHMNTLSVFPLFAAWLAGVPVRICHNHTTAHKVEKKRTWIKLLFRPLNPLFATHLFACNSDTAAWMYGKRRLAHGRVSIMRNAIDLNRYRFEPDKREDMRARLGLQNMFVIGHVGRFCEQKNHAFLLEIFSVLVKRRDDARLLLVGTGETLPFIREKAVKLGIADHIMFMGEQLEMQALYCAMDVFLLPSFYEGLPVVGVEAQTNGLPCIFSNEISAEVALCPNAHFLPLGDSSAWARLSETLLVQPRRNESSILAAKGYCINNEVLRLQKFYTTCYEKNERDNGTL